VPTMAELGLPKIRYYSNFGVFAPSGTPPQTIQAIEAAVTQALATPQYQAMLEKHFMQPGTGTGDAFRQQVKTEFENNRRLIAEENIRID